MRSTNRTIRYQHIARWCFVVFIACCTTWELHAQDVFFFVAGTRAPVQQTGDDLHQYDFILRAPGSGARAVLEIFDASIGSGADVVGFSKTVTLFRLYDGQQVEEQFLRNSLETINEFKYLNRWVVFDTLIASATTTWVLRVQGMDGDGVNAFKLRVTPLSESQHSQRWHIVAVHLPVTLVGLNEFEEAQFKPMTSDMKRIYDLVVRGEEQSTVLVRDSYGGAVRVPVSRSFSFEKLADQQNEWGIAISGSPIRVNNLVVKTASGESLEWSTDPIIVRKPTPPTITIDQFPMSVCTQVRLQLSNNTRRLFWNVTPQWVLGSSLFQGDSIIAEFPEPGTYLATVLLPTQGLYFPRYWKHNFSVSVNAPPKAKLSVPKTLLSPNEPVVLSAAGSYDPEKRLLTYQWFVNGEYRGNQATLRFFSGQPGSYEVKLIVSDGSSNSPCSQDVATTVLRVNTQPYGEIKGPHVVARSTETTFTLQNLYDADGDEIRIQWFGAGLLGDRTSPSVRVKIDTARVYTLKAVLNDQTSTSNATYTTSFLVRVNAEPKPVFQLPQKAAPGDKLLLSAQLSTDPDNPHLRYRWSLSDGSEFFTPMTYVVFQDPGTYTVTLTVDDGEGVENSVQSLTKTILINAPPIPVITAVERSNTSLISFSAEESYDADGDPLQYQWNFGDGTIASGKVVRHLYLKSGTYTVTLTVNDGQKLANSIQSAQHTLVINSNPVAQITMPRVCAPNESIVLDGTMSYDPDGTIQEYSWFLNGKEVAQGPRASITVPEPGDYAVALHVRDNSGFDDAVGVQTKVLHCNYPPVLQWSIEPSVAEPHELIVFDASATRDPEGNPVAIRWEFHDGTVLRGARVQKKFTSPGKQTVRLIADDGQQLENSIQTQEIVVLVNNSPIIVTKKVLQTNELRVFLDAFQSYDIDGHALSFDWLLPDGTHRTEPSFWWHAPNGGPHILTLTVNDGQGKTNSLAREVVRIHINRPPIAVVDSMIQTCTGKIVLFNSTRCYDPDNDVFSTHWDFGDGTTSDETNPTHKYIHPGMYTVQLTLNDGKAPHPTIAHIPVFVEGSPQALQRFSDTTVCANVPLEFDGTMSVDPNGPLGSFTWDFGDGSTALGAVVTHAYTKAGTYTVTLTVVGSGSGRCSRVSQATSIVRVIEGPQPSFSVPSYVSIGEQVPLDARSSQTHGFEGTALWRITSNDTVIIREGSVSSVAFSAPGEYTIALILTTNAPSTCTTATTVRTLRVNAPPQLLWSLPEVVALGEPVMFDASHCYDPDGVLTSIRWYVDGTEVSTNKQVAFTFTTPGYHTVQLRITDNSNTSTNSAEDTRRIFVNSQPSSMFILPTEVYEGEVLHLVPIFKTDADGDTLLIQWKANGHILPSPQVVCSTPGPLTITLVTNDRRELSNSVDSISQTIHVRPAPDLTNIEVPFVVVQGTTLMIEEFTSNGSLYFIDGDEVKRKTQFSNPGVYSLTLAWMPKDTILQKRTLDVRVLEPLQFLETSVTKRYEWNPANPRIVLSAPPVNRENDANILYEWRVGEKVVGFGNIVEIPVQKGRNTVRIRATERNVWNSKPSESEFTIFCE